jgi:hypothetical protein
MSAEITCRASTLAGLYTVFYLVLKETFEQRHEPGLF